jgi:excisionase family DNA binding protein
MKVKLDDLMTITEAANLVGCSRQNIHQWINKGFLGAIEMGNQKLVNRDAVLATSEIMEKRRHEWIKRRGEKKSEKD